jgi:hydroxybutyrate-dimer hydrolase
MLDMTAAGGYGTLYGPNVDAQGRVTAGEGRIAGTEYIAFSDDGSGRKNVTLMVQVPASFDPRKACIITATASGSRGVYGAITTGEWGLKRGCAVAYSDKGTGAAPHDLMNDTVPLIDGTRSTAAAAGKQAAFNAGLTAGELAAFNTATPNRFAFKHAHSGQNPEKDWGRTTLQAVEFAYYVLNERYGDRNILGERLRTLKPSNTIVIASSISNGGGAAIAAAEQDSQGLINGVAVSEPAVELPANPGVTVQRGGTALPVVGKTLVDFTSYANLYQPCASLAASVSGSPYAAAFAAGFASTALPIAPNRCAALRTAGLLNATTTAAQAEEALQKLRDYGWEPESSELHASLAAFEVAPAVSVTFANSLSRASVKDNLCGYSYAGATAAGAVTPLAPGRWPACSPRATACRHRAACSSSTTRASSVPRAIPLRLGELGRGRLEHAGCAVPAQSRHGQRWRRQGAAGRYRRDKTQRQSAGQAGHHRPWPCGCAAAREPHDAALCGAQPESGRRCQQAQLCGGHECPALRQLHRPAHRAAGLRHALHPAACLPEPRARCHV